MVLLSAPALGAQERPNSEKAGFASSKEQTTTKAPPPSLEGIWAQLQVTKSIADVPIVGDVASTTRSYLRVQIDQNGRRLSMTEKVCLIQIESESDQVRTIIPDAFLRAISGRTRKGKLEKRGDHFEFVQPAQRDTYGVKLRHAGRESLPDEPDDPRVWDEDGDGNPGLTIWIRGLINGEIYVIQRAWSALRGVIKDSDRFGGSIRWGTEQRVLGATSFLLDSEPSTKPAPHASAHYFRMQRIDPATTCKDILHNRKTLFRK